ncbi:MAG: hypothetical protein R3A50_04770 [Saprospiraceae bacterium]
MANKKLLKFGAIALGFYIISNWVTRRTYSKISVQARGFRIHKLLGDSVEFRLFLRVTNQSDIPAPVSGFIGQLIYLNPSGSANDPSSYSVLGNLNQVAPVQVPGFGTVDIEFSMVSGLFGAAWEILNILTNGNPFNLSSVDYKNLDLKRLIVKGTLKIGVIPVDILTALK